MNLRIPYLIGLCAVLGAVAGWGAAAWTIHDKVEPVKSKDAQRNAAPREESHGSEDLGARVIELERRVAKMQSLIQRLVLGQRSGAEEPNEKSEPSPGASAELDIADPVFEAAVADIIERDIERRKAERQEKRRQKREQELQASVAQLTKTLELRPDQQSQVSDLLASHWDKLSELRDDAAPNLTREERRSKIGQLVGATEEALSRIFDSRQQESYRALPDKQKLKLGGRSERESPPKR